MDRRALLLGTGSVLTASLAGCAALSSLSGTSDHCSPADAPLSTLITTDVDGTHQTCEEPSFTVENERDDAVEATISVDHESFDRRTYDLQSGERIVEQRGFKATSGTEVTVQIGDDVFSGRWDGQSCYRHAVAIGSGGISVGWLEPIQGPGGIGHACYPGDDARLSIENRGEQMRTVSVEIENHCADESITKTADIEGNSDVDYDGVLVSGGDYGGKVEVVDGPSETFSYPSDGGCFGIRVLVRSDGEIDFFPSAIL